MNMSWFIEIMQWLIILSGPIALTLIILQGWLRRDVLEAGPIRRVGLVPADLLVGLGLMLVGPVLVSLVVKYGATGEAQGDAATKTDVLCFACKILLAQVSGQGLSLLYLFWRARSKRFGLWRIGLLPRKLKRDLQWGLLGFCVAIPMVMSVISITVYIGQWFGQEVPQLAHEMLRLLVQSDSLVGSVLIVISAVLAAPILEESLFRGLVQSVMVETLGESRRWIVVITASFMFATMHGIENWQVLPGLFVLGMVLGWLYERSGSLWPGIFLHMSFNLLNILLALATTSPAG